MKLFSFKKIHLIGIKGQGMTALAEVLVKNGIDITGSDVAEIFTTDEVLRGLAISISESFAPSHIPSDAEAVIYSMAYTKENNPELAAAKTLAIPVLSYPEALGLLSREKMTLAVCGTHGKTTTSALLAETLRFLKQDPLAIVGSQIHTWHGNALVGKGINFVLEADEYQNKLRLYSPYGVILTSIDWDHPDYFPSFAAYVSVFADFVKRVPRQGVVVACGDAQEVIRITRGLQAPVITYGFRAANQVTIVDYRVIDPMSGLGQAGFFQEFILSVNHKKHGPFRLKLSGQHNAQNAAAVFALLLHFKYPAEEIIEAFKHFSGTKRRFEKIGEHDGAIVYDDFAHHPDEIRATLVAFRELYPKRKLRVIFHPHTFSRTRALFQEFVASLALADEVFLLDIYGSAREKQGGVSSRDLVTALNQEALGKAQYTPNAEELITALKTNLSKNDLLVTMGAGDVWQIAEALVKK